jgi:hypothetical protein
LINHLVEDNLFERGVHIFLRKGHAHQLTPKGRLWELADGRLNLRLHDALTKQKVEYEDGALVLDWVANVESYAIALMDNGREEKGSVLGTSTPCFSSISNYYYYHYYFGSHFWFRTPETEQEDEQVCTRVFADMSGEGTFWLPDRPY